MRGFVTSFLLAALLAGDSFAHGGIVNPPPSGGVLNPGRGNPGKPKKPKGGETPPPGGSPTTPPSEPTTPPTTPSDPPPDAPTTPPSAPPTSGPSTAPPRGPTTRPGSVAGGAPAGAPQGGAGGARTGGGPAATRRAPTSNDRWETWWNYTRELYLGRHLGNARHVQSGTSGYLTGRSSVDPAGDPSLLPETIRRDLLPVLARALRDSSTEVADSAAIALGRSVATHESGQVLPMLVKNLGHASRSPREAAVLGLGILGGAGAIEPLRSIALDQPNGRKLCGASGPIDLELRGFAALALGLVGTQESMTPLVTLASTASTPRELAAAAIVGLGLQRESAGSAVVALARLLDERSLDREVRAQVPIAVSRLPVTSARGLLPKMIDQLGDKRTCNEVSRSLALAIGRIATPDDAEAVTTLEETARSHNDASTRQFALLGLGRLFELHPVESEAGAKSRDATIAFLAEQLRSSKQRTQRPWAALALGLVARGDSSFGTDAPAASLQLARRRLVEALDGESDPSLQGAIAIGLGLSQAPQARSILRAHLADTKHPGLRGHLATSLGMLQDRDAVEPLRTLLADGSLPPSTRLDVARGLALAGDPGFETRLLELLADADDLPSAVAYAKALGLVGSRTAADPLRRIAEDPTLPEVQRGFAVVAIGLLAEKSALPWNVPFLVDANYTVPLRPLEEVLDLL